MGRFLKNSIAKAANKTLNMPTGTSTDRPTSPLNGAMRYNESIHRLEIYDTGVWHITAKEDLVTVVKDTFSGNNSTSDFLMSKIYSVNYEALAVVYVNAVWQNPGVNYTFNGSTNIHFTSTPPMSAIIVVLHNYATTTTTWAGF
jgi:hypothetical protein